jgi:hypothetical protein
LTQLLSTISNLKLYKKTPKILAANSAAPPPDLIKEPPIRIKGYNEPGFIFPSSS